ncbi:MAG: hypothetical protein EA339_12610 [Rhodobacteraceae bacterium]|nr:MAG: hypothetical protein EA339_12610 [Paracoccaceae bacterium]
MLIGIAAEKLHAKRCGRAMFSHAQLCKGSPAQGPRPMRWGQLGIAIFLTLTGLMIISSQTDHCARDTGFCQPGPAHREGQDAPLTASLASADAQRHIQSPPPRAVLGHAFAPLPLSFEQGTTRNFVLPPGQSMLDMATLTGRISVDHLSLIAVVTQDGLRHALVRLPDGRILRLSQGDALDGGIVAAISDEALFLIGPDMTTWALVLGG